MMGNQHNEYVFEVELLASVRVRATSESDAREMIPAALEAPGADVIRLANETNFIAGRNAIVTEVTFFTEEGVFRLVEVRARCYGDDSFSSLHADYAAA
jgi:hypothetical protein